jgi:hypothetical protein
MGFGKNLGNGLGKLVGGVVRLGTDTVADLTGSSFIREVGEAAEQTTIATGNLAGQAADGVGGVARGIASGNDKMTDQGFKEAFDSVGTVAKGIAAGVGSVVKDGATVVTGLKSGDTVAAGAAARNLAKVAAVSVLAVGILDVFDVIDFVPDTDVAELGGDVELTEPNAIETGAQFVDPHEVSDYVRSDGTEVEGYWRDGDGNTNIDRTIEQGGGYFRHNPTTDI